MPEPNRRAVEAQRLGKNAVELEEYRASFETSLRKAPQDEAFYFNAIKNMPSC
jgi:hypothetical protein